MTNQHYRVILDRSRGDNPQLTDIQVGDRFTYLAVTTMTDSLIRIERPDPVPTSDEHYCDNCLGIDPGSCINGPTERPQPPTREQIAEALRVHTTHFGQSRYDVQADAVLALLNGADRG